MYALKYERLKYNDITDILRLKGWIEGEIVDGDIFRTKERDYEYITKPELNEKYVIANAHTFEELKEMYDYDDSYTKKDILDLFKLDFQDTMPIIKNNHRKDIDLDDLYYDSKDEKTLYQCINGENCVILNEASIKRLEKVKDNNEVHKIFSEYGDKLVSFDETRKKDGTETIMVKNGHISSVNKFINYNSRVDRIISETGNNSDISVSGLLKSLKSNIIGHDEELKRISTILVMNYLSTKEYGTESILVPGPTGTGKTATFKCAASYFDVPFKVVNTCNLVPDGIVGTSPEDVFLSIIDECDGDKEKAEKAIIVFDEFDKLGLDTMDYKESLINVFLKLLEGSKFPINTMYGDTEEYDTTMSSKICLGTFEQAFRDEERAVGFNKNSNQNKLFDRDLLVAKGYFSKELLSRIHHYIPYKELSDYDKKRIILESKLSYYLLKKQRLEKQFNIRISEDNKFADSILEKLKEHDNSIRDINNIVSDLFVNIEYELLENKGKYKELHLYGVTPDKSFDLK